MKDDEEYFFGLDALYAMALMNAVHMENRRRGLMLAYDFRNSVAGGCRLIGVDPKPLEREVYFLGWPHLDSTEVPLN